MSIYFTSKAKISFHHVVKGVIEYSDSVEVDIYNPPVSVVRDGYLYGGLFYDEECAKPVDLYPLELYGEYYIKEIDLDSVSKGFFAEFRYSGVYASIVFCFVLPDNYFARYGVVVNLNDVTLFNSFVYERFQAIEGGVVYSPSLYGLSGYFTELAYRFYGVKGTELFAEDNRIKPSVLAFPTWKAGDSVDYYFYYVTMDGVKVNTDIRTMLFKSNMSSSVKNKKLPLQRYEFGFPIVYTPLGVKVKPEWDDLS